MNNTIEILLKIGVDIDNNFYLSRDLKTDIYEELNKSAFTTFYAFVRFIVAEKKLCELIMSFSLKYNCNSLLDNIIVLL